MYFFYFHTWNKHFNQSLFFLSSPTSLSQAVFPCGWPVPGRPPAQGVCPLPATQWTTTEPAVTFLAAEQSHLWQKQSSQHFPSHHSLPVFHGEFTTHARMAWKNVSCTIPIRQQYRSLLAKSDQYLTSTWLTDRAFPDMNFIPVDLRSRVNLLHTEITQFFNSFFFLVGTFTWKSSLGTKKVVSAKNPALIYPPVTDLQGEVEQNSVKPQNSSRTYFSRFICCRISLP